MRLNDRLVAGLALAFAVSPALSCVSGGKVRADGEVIRSELVRAEKQNAKRCAPREYALAEFNLDAADGELDEGNSVRAQDHIELAEDNVKKALVLSKYCGPKQVVIKEKQVAVVQALDRDGDGVPDSEDRCPDNPGPKELQGCPDRDGDGVPDIDDKCPDQPGPASNGGCPVKVYKLVVRKKDKIEIKQQVHFATNKSKVLPDSFELLNEVASLFKDNPDIKKVRIEGHTDSVGSDSHNMKLSQDRANSVMAYIIKQGVDPTRMEAVGYGPSRPIESNATSSGRAANRRTEFNIVAQGTDPAATPAPAP